MGSALFELEEVLRSKEEKLTPQEANILGSCKSKAIRHFTSSALAGGAAAWTATWKLSKIFRVNLAAGAAVFFGLWGFGRSLDSSEDHILQLEESRIQKELANIMVTKFQNHPWKMQLMSKYFYLENLYDDTTSDHPKLSWRYRNFYSDNFVHGQRTHDYDSSDSSRGSSHDVSDNTAQVDSKKAPDSKRTNLETKHILINPVLDMMEEPDSLDCLFGYSAPVEEIQHSSTSNKQPGIHNRGHRRSHRRRRMRHHESLSNSEDVTAA